MRSKHTVNSLEGLQWQLAEWHVEVLETERAGEELFEWRGYFFGFLGAKHIARYVQVYEIRSTAP